MKSKKLTILAFLILLLAVGPSFGQRPLKYSKEEPIRLDFDMENTAQPKPIATGYLYDLIDGTIFQPVRRSVDVSRIGRRKKEAVNVNVLDEVPNSSWFTNRIGTTDLSVDEVRRGPNTTNGPKSGKLTVLRGKTIGVTPGFWVKDETGEIYILKFDPPEYPELATGAEMMGTKLFHAFGYNVPENHIFRFRREDLEIADGAKFTNEKNKKAKMTAADLDLILSRVAQQDDGRFRAVASRLIKGKPIGGFGFSGRRKDDPNDIIPHEIRRDVRALKLFAAWTEHNDLRVGNTLDFFVKEDNREFIRHYLIDFGSTFGSDSIQPNLPEAGREHGLDFDEAAKVLLSAGTYQPGWRNGKNNPVFSPAVGRYSTKYFRPQKWKSNFSLAALGQMTTLDGFWAARIISSFSPGQIRAIVETAEYSSLKDTEYLINQIMARQSIIARYYFNKRAGFERFSVGNEETGKCLNFQDLRLRFPTEERVNDVYEYRIVTPGKRPQTISKGTVTTPKIKFDSSVLETIAGIGNNPRNRGIARLILNRKSEKQSASVYLWSKDGSDLQIAGIVH